MRLSFKFDPSPGAAAASRRFEFDDHADKASVELLTEQLVRKVHERDTIQFGELYSATCNTTPADSRRYRKAIEKLVACKEVVVEAPNGASRRKANTIRDKDVIRLADQRIFHL
ncbi:MAG: hypothetical protein ACYC0F_17940 [Rhodanobacter sp.]